MTKYYSEKHKFEKDSSYDSPISLRDYTQIESSNNITRQCPYCNITLSRLIDYSGLNPSFYCSKCVIEFPDKTKVKTKSRLATTEQTNNNDDPSVAYAPEVGLKRKNKEPKGTFRKLKERGINIISYEERGWRKNRNDD
jgi:hypothetical protein